jgi:hypothetical protein
MAQTSIAGNNTPAPTRTQTGIAGNNTAAASQATAARATSVNSSTVFHAVIALMLVAFGVTLAGQNLSFFWKLVVGSGLIITGGQLSKVKGYDKYRGAWPQVFRGLGWVVIVTTLLMSGIGKLTGSVAENVHTAALCVADDKDPICVAKKAKEEAEKAKAKAARIALIQQQAAIATPQQYVPPAPTPTTSQACEGEFAKLNSCELVTFGDEPFKRKAKSGKCIVFNPKRDVQQEYLGGDVYQYMGISSGVKVHFFDIVVGEKSPDGTFTCT